MATAMYEDADERGTTGSRRRSSSRGTTSMRGAASVLNTAALLDIVERLGVVDMVVDRIKHRLEEVDIDDLLDEAADYLKRNPEVLVVSLGAITIAAGALVYMNKRNDSAGSRRSSATTGTSTASSRSRTRSASR